MIPRGNLAASRSSKGIPSYAGNGDARPVGNGTAKNVAVLSSVSLYLVFQENSQESYTALITSMLADGHKKVSVNPKVLGGTPHLKGTRLSVAHILAEVYHLGSIDAVVEKRHITKSQVKEALAYAHDFMEIACDLSERDD